MADINRELEELAELTQQVNAEMRMYGQLTKETADKKRDAEFLATHGLHNITKATEKGVDALGALGKAVGQTASAMYQGKKGAAAFNDSVDSLTTAATAAAAGLMLLAGPIGLLGAAVLGSIKALGSYTKAANEMGDKLYQGYQGLAEAGAAARDGMTGLFEDAKKLGLSMDEIGKYTELIGANSKDLALFSGTVFEGRQKFADTVKAMEPFKESLMNAGLSQDQINAGAMQYLRLQTRIGATQNKITTDLGASAAKYMLEMDALTKITGLSRKEQEDVMEAARSEERFAAKLQELRSQGRDKEARELELTNLMLIKENKLLAQGFRDTTTGMITTEAAQKAMLVTQGQVMVQSDRLSNGLARAEEGATIIGKTASETSKSLTPLAKAGAFGDAFGDYAANLRSGMTDFVKAREAADAELAAQGARGGKATDDLVQKQTQLRITQQQANEATERFVKAGIGPATAAMEKLAKATASGAEGLNKMFGIGKTAKPEGPQTTTDQAKKDLENSTEKAKLANERAAAAEKDANLTRVEKDRIKKEARDSEAAVTQDIFKQREAQLREQNARREARRAGTAPVTAPATAPAAATGGGGAASAAPAAAGGGATPTAPRPAASAPAVAAPASSAPAAAPARPSGPDEAGAKPPADKEVKASPVGEVQEGAEVRIGREIRKGGTVSWRTNNPGNISYGGLAKQYGAIGAWKKPDGDAQQRSTGIAIFPNIEAGNQLKMALWRRPMYIDKTIDQGVQQWTGNYQGPGSTYAKDLAKAAGATLETRIRDLTDSQLLGMTEKQKVWEGFKPGTVVSAAGGAVLDGPKSGYSVDLTAHGNEAIIPLKNGAVPVQLSIKDDIRGLGDDVADQLREIREQSNTNNETALAKVSEEFKSAMAQMSQQLSTMSQNQNNNGMTVVAGLLQDLVNATKNGVDVQQKILASNY